MNLIIDASVAIKWFVMENLHDEARHLLDGGDDLHAPDLLVVEIANIAWKKALRKEIDHRQARAIAVACLDGVPSLHPSTEIVGRAAQIALELNHPVYDCVYLACAESVEGFLVAADSRLQSIVKDTKFEALVVGLDQSSSGVMGLNITMDKINRLIELSNLMRASERNVYDAVRSKGELPIVNMKDMTPFFDSPTLRRMYEFFESLTHDERADCLALMWLGRGYDGKDWQSICDRANRSIGGYANRRYIYPISLTVYLEQGLKLLQREMRGEA